MTGHSGDPAVWMIGPGHFFAERLAPCATGMIAVPAWRQP